MKLGGYVTIDKRRTILLHDAIAILTAKDKYKKGNIILKHESYFTTTSTRKIIERFEGGKKSR